MRTPFLLGRLRAQNLLPSNRLPVKPSVQVALHHPDEPVTNRRVWPHQFACHGLYPLTPLMFAAGDQDVPGFVGRRFFDHATNIFFACVRKKPIPPNKSARSQQWETRNRPSDLNKACLAAKGSLIRTAQTGHEIQADAQDSQD